MKFGVEIPLRRHGRVGHGSGMSSRSIHLVDIFPWMIHIPERFSLLFSRYLIVYTDAR